MFQYSLTGRDGSGSGFGSWKTVPAVPVPLSVSGKTVPVSGSGSAHSAPCQKSAKARKRAFLRKTCNQPGLKQPGLGTPKSAILSLIFLWPERGQIE